MPVESSALNVCARKPLRHGTTPLTVCLARIAPDDERARCKMGAAICGACASLAVSSDKPWMETENCMLQQTACKLGHPLLYGGAEDLMAGAYSTDLRERVLVAVEAGEPADAVAEQFMIGRSSVYRWLAAAR